MSNKKLPIRLASFTFDPLDEQIDIPNDLQITPDRKALNIPKSQLAEFGTNVTKPFILQFHKSLNRDEQTTIKDKYGLRLAKYLPELAYLEMMDDKTLKSIAEDPLVRAVIPYQPAFKIAPHIGNRNFRTFDRSNVKGFWLNAILFPSSDIKKVREVLNDMNVEEVIIIDDRDKGGSASLRFMLNSQADISKIAQINEVQWIEDVGEAKLDNGITSGTIQSGTPGIHVIWNAGLHGENQIVGVIDNVIDINHCFFTDSINNTVRPDHRKIVGLHNISGDGIGLHGTFVCGIVGGDDFNTPGSHTNCGIAWASRITFGNSRDLNITSLLNYLNAAATNGAFIHTNSWHDEPNPQYSQFAADVDTFVWQNEDHLVLGSSGNVGEQIGPPGTAKNALCVSATRKSPNEMNFGDGNNGPTPDGRRKPEIMAPGCSITSAQSGTHCTVKQDDAIFGFSPICATSWATPAAAGAAALVRQYYTEGFYPTGNKEPRDAFIPSGALMKATILNSTIDMIGIPGYPNNQEGWGLVRLNNVLYFPGSMRNLRIWDIHNRDGITTGESQNYHITITNNNTPLKVTLVWSEPPGESNSTSPVVNNLDLQVVSPDHTQIFLGNVFDGGFSKTGGTPDLVNNVEMVLVNNPEQGDWVIRVIGTAINVGNPGQGYALVVTAHMS